MLPVIRSTLTFGPMRIAALFASLLLLASASETHAQSVPATPPGLPSVTLAPDLDRVLRDYETAWRRGDAAALAALFAEDGFVLQGGRPPVRGRAAIEAAYTGQGGGPLRLRALAAATADTVGYIIGAYGYGDAAGDMGKFTLTLRSRRASAPRSLPPTSIPSTRSYQRTCSSPAPMGSWAPSQLTLLRTDPARCASGATSRKSCASDASGTLQR